MERKRMELILLRQPLWTLVLVWVAYRFQEVPKVQISSVDFGEDLALFEALGVLVSRRPTWVSRWAWSLLQKHRKALEALSALGPLTTGKIQ